MALIVTDGRKTILIGSMPSILLVEDNPDLRECLAHVLAAGGFDVATADDGQSALDHMGRRRANKPDLIVTDLHMPRMDGLTFLHQVRERPAFRRIPAVMITGLGDARRHPMPGVPIVEKCDPDQLLRLISRSLRSADRRVSPRRWSEDRANVSAS